MNTQFGRNPDRLVEAFLEEGPVRMSDRLFDAIVHDIYRNRQRDHAVPWRYLYMNRSAFAAAIVVVAIAVVGAALVLTRPNERVGTKPSPAPAIPAPAVGPTLGPAGSTLRAGTFSEPFTFTLPAFPDGGSTPVAGEAFDASLNGGAGRTRAFRVYSSLWGAVSFHDDEPLAADMCRPTGPSIDDVPATPAAVGTWLESAAGLTVSAPVTITVDGRPAIAWDTVSGADCDKAATRQPPWFGAGERHRIYAVPTASDTILIITWGTDWSNGTEEYLDEVNVAADELVRSMKFDK